MTLQTALPRAQYTPLREGKAPRPRGGQIASDDDTLSGDVSGD